MTGSFDETDYLLSSPVNAKHLLDGIARFDAAATNWPTDAEIDAATARGPSAWRLSPARGRRITMPPPTAL